MCLHKKKKKKKKIGIMNDYIGSIKFYAFHDLFALQRSVFIFHL